MRILILGATGRTGKLLLQQALASGYHINVLLRDKSKVALHSALTIFEGTPADKNILANAMDGCEAVLSALNISRTSDFPWSALRTPKTLLSETAAHLIDLAPKYGISRVIVISAWGAGSSRQEIPWWFKWLIDNSNIGIAYRDQEKQEELFEASALNYTIARPVGLVNSLKSKPVRVSLNNIPKPHLTISRLDVAKFMLQILEGGQYIRQMPVLSF